MKAGNRYCVYKHETPSGKVYIGVTSVEPEKRWSCGHGYSYNPHFWRAIVKYGWDNISHEILFDGLSKEEAYSLEIELIREHNSTDPQFGYNITEGGCGGTAGVRNSEETRRKKSESARRSWNSPNRARRKSSKSSPRFLTDSEKLTISERQKALWRDPTVRKSIMDGMKNGKPHGKKKPVSQYTEDGELVKVWESMCAIEKELGIPTGAISACCSGKRKFCKGFIWKLTEAS